MTKMLNVGMIGCGFMGRTHSNAYRKVAHFFDVPYRPVLKVVCGLEEAEAKAFADLWGYESSTTDWRQVVERGDIDIVDICVPNDLHAEIAVAAAEAGKAILCEKPLALSLAEADRALAAVEKARVPVQIGFMRRYDPAYAAAKKRIEAGEIGAPFIFKAIGRDPEPPPPSYFEAGLEATIFLDSSIHEFDLARWLMGDEVAEVHAFAAGLGAAEYAGLDPVDAGVVNLRFSRGGIGNVESFRHAGYGYDIRTEIVGSRGTIQVGYLRQTQQVVLSAAGAAYDVVDHWLVRFADAYLAEMRDFVETLRTGREPRVTGADGRQALAISLAAQRSCREARPIAVAP